MKRTLLAVGLMLVLGVLSFTGNANAAPIGHSNEGSDYLIDSASLNYWWLGVYTDVQKRDVVNGMTLHHLKKTELTGYLGYSYVDACLLYLSTGKRWVDSPNYLSDNDWNYGLGTRISLLDHIIPDPLLYEDRLRLNMILQYSRSNIREMGWFGKDATLEEYYGSLLLSVVNDLDGNKLFVPNSMSLFIGPVWSDLKSALFDEKNKLGFTYGLEVYVTERVSLDVRVQQFNTAAIMGGLNIHL